MGPGAEGDAGGAHVCALGGEAGEGWVGLDEPVALGFIGGAGWAWDGLWDEDKTGVLLAGRLQQTSEHAPKRPRSKSPKL
jgi:hypothetical protein